MPQSSANRRNDGPVLLLLFALLCFASPFTVWWARGVVPWYFPFLLWAGLIAAIAITQRARRRDDA